MEDFGGRSEGASRRAQHSNARQKLREERKLHEDVSADDCIEGFARLWTKRAGAMRYEGHLSVFSLEKPDSEAIIYAWQVLESDTSLRAHVFVEFPTRAGDNAYLVNWYITKCSSYL